MERLIKTLHSHHAHLTATLTVELYDDDEHRIPIFESENDKAYPKVIPSSIQHPIVHHYFSPKHIWVIFRDASSMKYKEGHEEAHNQMHEKDEGALQVDNNLLPRQWKSRQNGKFLSLYKIIMYKTLSKSIISQASK